LVLTDREAAGWDSLRRAELAPGPSLVRRPPVARFSRSDCCWSWGDLPWPGT